uniref:Uncharacterized protein n=1 Tax=Romanomermis culicivorax TaxID=13658 RepID=A0A915JE98_ROMCU
MGYAELEEKTRRLFYGFFKLWSQSHIVLVRLEFDTELFENLLCSMPERFRQKSVVVKIELIRLNNKIPETKV